MKPKVMATEPADAAVLDEHHSDGTTCGPSVPIEIDLDILTSLIGYRLRRAQSRLFAEFESIVGDGDITPGAFGVLTIIRANPGITQVAIAAAFGIDKSTLSPVIMQLARHGFIRREVMLQDRRSQALTFEPDAEPRYQAVRARVLAFEGGVDARLTEAEKAEFMRLLAKVQPPIGRDRS